MHGRTSSIRAGSRRFFGAAVLTVMLLLMLGGAALATDYYVDSVGGSDSNSGTSSSSPWQSLHKLNYTNWPTSPYTPRIYAPGDTINLKCNSVWNNQPLYLYDNGNCTASSYVTVQSYSTGNKPKINGGEWHAITNVTNMAARMNTSSASATKRISLPSGKVLKAISIGKRAGTFTGTWKLVSTGNPTIGPISFPSGPPALPAMDYATDWTTASANVDITVSITSGSANASYVSFDRFLIGDPGSSTNDKLVDLADLARGQGVTLNGWHPDTNGVNFGTNLWKGRQTTGEEIPSGYFFGFEYADQRNRISGWKIGGNPGDYKGLELTSANDQNPNRFTWDDGNTPPLYFNGTTGIGLATDTDNPSNYLEIGDCLIHNTSGQGINLRAFGPAPSPQSYVFDKVRIHDCEIHSQNETRGTVGIMLWGGDNWDNPNYFNDPRVEYCVVHHTGRHGIMLNSTKYALISDCEAYECGSATITPPNLYSQCAIELHDAWEGIIQYCRSHNNHAGAQSFDGGGYDIDWRSNGCIYQYNSSWENESMGYYVCSSDNYNTIVRFNYSYNDGTLKYPRAGIALFSPQNCKIYNNTVINSTSPPLLEIGSGVGNTIANNIFFTNTTYCPEVLKFEWITPNPTTYKFQNNLYWHISGDAPERFVAAGYGYNFYGWEYLVSGTDIAFANPLLVNPYANPASGGDIHIQSDSSPAVDNGRPLTSPPDPVLLLTGETYTDLHDYYNVAIADPMESGAAMYTGGGGGSSWQASTDFSTTQGTNDWWYQYFDGSYNYMTYDSGWGAWLYNNYCLIGSNWQHPDYSGGAIDSVRTWVAPYNGTIRIQGTATLAFGSGTNGVQVTIKQNSTAIGGGTFTLTNPTDYSHTWNFTTSVTAGDAIRFIVNCNGTDTSNDTTNWDPTITYLGGGGDVTVTFVNIANNNDPINGWHDNPSPDGINFGSGYWTGWDSVDYGLSGPGKLAEIAVCDTYVQRTVYLPSNKILKKVDIGKIDGATGTITFSAPGSGNPDRDVPLSSCPQTGYQLNWSNPSPTVTITITITNSCKVSGVGFDNFVFG